MNIVLDIGIYMLASSAAMIGYVWFKYTKHTQLDYENISETNQVTEEPSAKENLAA